jgi:folate-dependent phosphoribosylglycinamide formyltransferase PurN
MTQKIKPIYAGKLDDFHWVGFGSGSGTNLAECAKLIKPVAIFSDKSPYDLKSGKGAKVAESNPSKLMSYGLESLIDIPRLILNGFQECGSSKTQSKEVYEERSLRYNQMIVDTLHKFEDDNGFGIDLIVLGGYMRLVGEPLLEAYQDKIINVHPANLSLVTYLFDTYDLSNPSDYQSLFQSALLSITFENIINVSRTFVGEDAVYDALKHGQKETCSSVIMVDKGVDNGEILVTGSSLAVRDDYLKLGDAEKNYVLREVADSHQTKQKEVSDWPALTTALKLISQGRIGLGEYDSDIVKMHFGKWRFVYIDNGPVKYGGLNLNDIE